MTRKELDALRELAKMTDAEMRRRYSQKEVEAFIVAGLELAFLIIEFQRKEIAELKTQLAVQDL